MKEVITVITAVYHSSLANSEQTSDSFWVSFTFICSKRSTIFQYTDTTVGCTDIILWLSVLQYTDMAIYCCNLSGHSIPPVIHKCSSPHWLSML